MIRGKGSDQTRKTDDNYAEQMAFKAHLAKIGIVSSNFSPPASEQPVKKTVTKAEKKNGNAAPEKEKPVARMASPIVTPTSLSIEIRELDKQMDKVREALADNAPTLMVVYSLNDFYNSAIGTIQHVGSTLNHTPEELLSYSRKRTANAESIDHSLIVAKFDEAKETLKQTKNVRQTFDMIVEAAALCEKDLLLHKDTVAFTPSYFSMK